MPGHMHDDINTQPFIEEARELLSELEEALLELEENPQDKELIDRVFRAMHTIKGSGAMFGFDDMAAFTHEVETVFDKVREGHMTVERKLLDLTLAARDHIAGLLQAAIDGQESDLAAGNSIVAGLRELSGASDVDVAEFQESVPGPLECDSPSIFRVRFKPNPEVFLTGTNPVGLLEELGELGQAQIFAHMDEIPVFRDLNPEHCHLYWDVILKTCRSAAAIRDVFIFVEDDCELSVEPLKVNPDLEEEDILRLGDILLQRGDINADDLSRALRDQKRIGQVLTEKGSVSPSKVASALAEQNVAREAVKQRKADDSASSIRVGAAKLDQLIDLVGELVIVQARLSQEVSLRQDTVLAGLAEELERLSDELRDSALSVRMLPIGTTFSKFRRLVRDLSAELGKEIELETEGAETELDKTVIERLNDPLVHLLRNSIDHGVEMPDEREAKGKGRKGHIRLVAEHSGGEVHIRIQDDGGGISADKVKAKAVERGLLTQDAADDLSPKEAFALIFEAGFSTAASVTSVSGRGVGMDVVKRAIEGLRGAIDVDSAPGQGTVITIKLPLTLAIIDGLQVHVQDEYYVLPLAQVEECVEHMSDPSDGGREQRLLNLRGEIVPYIRLREWFNIPGKTPGIEQIVITNVADTRVGIVVDNVIGEHQTVIKSLGRVYRDVEGISGATIQGDGSMALILDIPRLVRAVSTATAAA